MLLVEAVEESANMTVLAETAPGTLHGIAVRSHVSPPAATVTYQSRADASEQIILLKGFAQVTNDAGRERALPNAIVRVRRDQDGRNGLSRSRQVTMQPEPGHPRHLHICDQAGSAADMARAQKLLRGRDGLDPISQRPHETLYRLAHRLIVVDDRNQRL
ncbi:MAG: hypothetical protein WCB44_05195 [Stellaceae bacterium]